MQNEDSFLDFSKYRNQQELFKNGEGYIIGEANGIMKRINHDGAPLYTFSRSRELRQNYAAIPNLLTHPGSVLSFAVDANAVRETLPVRGEILGQKTVVFDPYGITGLPSASINILDTLQPKRLDRAANIAHDILQNYADIAPEEQKRYNLAHPTILSNEPTLRPKLAENLLTAMFIYVKVADEIPPDNKNIVYCAKMLEAGRNDWNDLMRAMQDYDGAWKEMINSEGRDFSDRDGYWFHREAKKLASEALSSARDPEVAAKIQTSSFDFADLRNSKMAVYMVIPEAKVRANAPWLRSVINRAESACGNVIPSADYHQSLEQHDRILFMLDDIQSLGRLEAFSFGMSPNTFMRGVTYWGMAPSPDAIIRAYAPESCPRDNMCVQYLDSAASRKDNGQKMLDLVREYVETTPVRPLPGKTSGAKRFVSSNTPKQGS